MPTKEECLEAAAEIYASILADPVRAEQLREARARRASQSTPSRQPGSPTAAARQGP